MKGNNVIVNNITTYFLHGTRIKKVTFVIKKKYESKLKMSSL